LVFFYLILLLSLIVCAEDIAEFNKDRGSSETFFFEISHGTVWFQTKEVWNRDVVEPV